jgi:hypothetical protein
MGAIEDFSRAICQGCHLEDPSVTERGRAYPMAVLCDSCWNVFANELAEEEGATAPPNPASDADDDTWSEPPTCADCGAGMMKYPTNYDRWVYLATKDLPAKDVAPRHRWRLKNVRAWPSSLCIDTVAVRIRAIEPLPGELVRPAHRAVCLSPDAVQDNESWADGSRSA